MIHKCLENMVRIMEEWVVKVDQWGHLVQGEGEVKGMENHGNRKGIGHVQIQGL